MSKVNAVIVGETIIPVKNIVRVNASYGRVEIEYREDLEKGIMRTVKLNAPYESTRVIMDDNTGDE